MGQGVLERLRARGNLGHGMLGHVVGPSCCLRSKMPTAGRKEKLVSQTPHKDMTADRFSPGRDQKVQGDTYSEVMRGEIWGSHSGIHSQLQPLLYVHLNLSSAIFVKRFEGTEHGIQPDQAADEVVKIHVPSLIRVTSDDHVVEMFI